MVLLYGTDAIQNEMTKSTETLAGKLKRTLLYGALFLVRHRFHTISLPLLIHYSVTPYKNHE